MLHLRMTPNTAGLLIRDTLIDFRNANRGHFRSTLPLSKCHFENIMYHPLVVGILICSVICCNMFIKIICSVMQVIYARWQSVIKSY